MRYSNARVTIVLASMVSPCRKCDECAPSENFVVQSDCGVLTTLLVGDNPVCLLFPTTLKLYCILFSCIATAPSVVFGSMLLYVPRPLNLQLKSIGCDQHFSTVGASLLSTLAMWQYFLLEILGPALMGGLCPPSLVFR